MPFGGGGLQDFRSTFRGTRRIFRASSPATRAKPARVSSRPPRETPSSSLLRCLRLYQGDARNSAQLAEQDAEGQAEHREHFPGHEGASGETGPRTVPKAAGPACRVPCPSRVRRAGRCQEQGPEGGPEARPRPGRARGSVWKQRGPSSPVWKPGDPAPASPRVRRRRPSLQSHPQRCSQKEVV